MRLSLCALLSLCCCTFQIPTRELSCPAPCVFDGGGGDGADAAQVPSGPGQPGAAPVASFALSVQVVGAGQQGRVECTIYGPGDDPDTITLTGAPNPLVLFSPGQAVPREQYGRLAAHLASHGLVVALQSPRAEWNHEDYRDDSIRLLRWLKAPVGEGAERLRGRVDERRIGVSGHGLGGKLAVLLAAYPPRDGEPKLRGVLALDPVDSPGLGPLLSGVVEVAKVGLPDQAPLALLGEPAGKEGASPCTPPGSNYEAFYEAAQAPAFAVTFTQGAHGDFVDDAASCAPCRACPAGPAARTTRELTLKYLTAYFLWTLAGRSELATYLTGPEFARDAAAGAVTRQAK